jgi:hypothetical protein
LPTHHDPPPSLKPSTKRNHDSPIVTSDFFNTIGHNRPDRRPVAMAVSPQLSDILGEVAATDSGHERTHAVQQYVSTILCW